MRQSPNPVSVRRKPLAGEPVGPGYAQAVPTSAGAPSLLDQLVEAIEGDLRSAGAPGPYRVPPASIAVARSDSPVRIDADAQALAAAGRQAVLRGFDLAASAEELASGSGEVTRTMEDATRKVRDALAGARGASGMILNLAKAAEEMADVVDAIASLARQANLLALHATIEAARAGEAGRDFSSVAGGVKSLSEETGHAAREMSARIAGLRDTASASMRAVERITAAVQEAQPAMAAAAGAVEDRNASLLEVAQRATDLSIAVGGICSKAAEVATVADAASRAAYGSTSLDDVARSCEGRFDPRRRY